MQPYVLVADAESDLGRLAHAELSKSGLEIVVARDGLVAHDLLVQRGAPVLLVTDLVLPRRDGFALVRGLRRVDPQRRVPAVVVSRFPKMLDAANQARVELGPLVVHKKPLASGVVSEALRDALRAQQQPSADARRPASAAPPPLVDPEKRRLARIGEMGVHDPAAPPDAELQAFVRRVASDFGVPMVLATLVLEDRQWFKAYTGVTGRLLAERGTLRSWSFCQHVVEGASPLVVPDAREHPLFADNPLVQEGTITGYAGAPLTTATGEVLGTLCIIDQKPLDIDAEGIRKLVKAARAVAGELEVRALRRRVPAAAVRADAGQRTYPFLEATFDALEAAVILLGSDRRVVLANAAVAALFGVDARTLHGKTRDEVVELLSVAFARAREDRDRLQVAATGPWVLREDIELQSPSERIVRWVGKPVLLPDGVGQLVTVTDITADVQVARAQERLARNDVLTGALNRRGAEEALAREEARLRRAGGRLAVALMDIDDLGRVNDTRGHAAGDAALREVAQCVLGLVRAVDAVARWGSDELLVVLPESDLDGAYTFAERARAAVAALVLPGAPDSRLTLSIGIAERMPDESIADLLARADQKLHVAKSGGRNRVVG